MLTGKLYNEQFKIALDSGNNDDGMAAAITAQKSGTAFGLLTEDKEGVTYLEWLIENSYHKTLEALIYKGAFLDGENELDLNQKGVCKYSPLLLATQIFSQDPNNQAAKAVLQIMLYGGVQSPDVEAKYNLWSKKEKARKAIAEGYNALDAQLGGAVTGVANWLGQGFSAAYTFAQTKVTTGQEPKGDAKQEYQSNPLPRICTNEKRAFVILNRKSIKKSLAIVTNILENGDADLVSKVLLWYGKDYNNLQASPKYEGDAQGILVAAIRANKDPLAIIQFINEWSFSSKKPVVDILEAVYGGRGYDQHAKDAVIEHFYAKSKAEDGSRDRIKALVEGAKLQDLEAISSQAFVTVAAEIECAIDKGERQVIVLGDLQASTIQQGDAFSPIEDLSASKLPDGATIHSRAIDLQGKWNETLQQYSKHAVAAIADNKGRTMLHAAVHVCDLKLVQTLIESFADINAADSDEKTPLDYAIKILIDNQEDKKSQKYQDALAIAKVLISGKGQDGWVYSGHKYGSSVETINAHDILHKCMVLQELELVNEMIKAGADVDRASQHGNLTLQIAINILKSQKPGTSEYQNAVAIAKALIEHSSVQALDAISILHTCVALQEKDLVDAAVKAGANINLPQKNEAPLQTSINILTSQKKETPEHKNAAAILKNLITGKGESQGIIAGYWQTARAPWETAELVEKPEKDKVDFHAFYEGLKALEDNDLNEVLTYLATNKPYLVVKFDLDQVMNEFVESKDSDKRAKILYDNAVLAQKNIGAFAPGLVDAFKKKMALPLPQEQKALVALKAELESLYNIISDCSKLQGLEGIKDSIVQFDYEAKIKSISEVVEQIQAAEKLKKQADGAKPKAGGDAQPDKPQKALTQAGTGDGKKPKLGADGKTPVIPPVQTKVDKPEGTSSDKEKLNHEIAGKKIGIWELGAFVKVATLALDVVLKNAGSYLTTTETAQKALEFVQSKVGKELIEQGSKYIRTDILRLGALMLGVTCLAYTYAESHNAGQDKDSKSQRGALNGVTLLTGVSVSALLYTGHLKPTVMMETLINICSQYMSRSSESVTTAIESSL